MCSDPDSRPPITPVPQTGAAGRHMRLTSADGNAFTAYRAEAARRTGVGIIVLPDYYGLTPFYEALALRLAEVGIDAIAIDYYGRTASPPPRGTDFDHVAHSRMTTWAGLQADVHAATRMLRSERQVEHLFSIGFCFGGRTSFLLSTLSELALSGVIGFYGWPVGPFANDSPAPADVTDTMQTPVMAVFGGADDKIAPDQISTFEDSLKRSGVEHRVHVYEGAPHSFFDRRSKGQEAAAQDAWTEIRAFIAAQAARD